MKKYLILVTICLTVIYSVTAIPRKNVEDEIANELPVLTMTLKTTTTPSTVLPKTERNCTCVPYYTCNEEQDDEFGFFPLEDFDIPNECKSIFDICCEPENIIQENIQPMEIIEPIENITTICGIRNISGLDFDSKANVSAISSKFYINKLVV